MKRSIPPDLGIVNQEVIRTIPGLQWRIADMNRPVRLMERDGAAGPYQSDGLGDDLLRLRNVDQDQPGGD